MKHIDTPTFAGTAVRRPFSWAFVLIAALAALGSGCAGGLEDDLEVAADHGLLRPPAVEDAPFLAQDCDRLVVDLPRRAVEVRLDARRARFVQSSRGTKSARVSGMRDQGATSTTVQTEPEPVLARTWRRPSRR